MNPVRKNPIGADGKPLACSICGSDVHLRAMCPKRSSSKGKGGKGSYLVDYGDSLPPEFQSLLENKEGENEEGQMRSPLEHYLVILALKPQARISSCGVMAESIGHEAPRKGVYMFTMECLDRIADTINKFSQEHLYHLAAEARNIKKQIEKILTVD